MLTEKNNNITNRVHTDTSTRVNKRNQNEYR